VGVHQTGTSEGCEPAEDMTAEVVGGETANVTMFNSCASSKGALDIRLMDPNGNLLGRGCFQIFDAAGSVIAEDCDDGDGVAHFTGLPEGRVTVVQTSAPEGYACCDSGSADVVEGQVSELNLVNAPVVLPPAEPTPTPVVPRITGLVLNEVLFQPPTGSPQFVELKNAGSADLNLDGVSLLTRKGERYRFPAGLRPLPPGGFLLVVFDGEDRVEGNTVHADRTSFMAPEADVVYLRDPADRRLDRIAWGERLPDAVNLSRGGFVAPLDPGTSIGRFPGSTRATDRFDWVTYPSARSSPGRANPLPRVEILLPLDGSVFDGPNVHVSWYVVAGAAKYHLEVASEQSFATLVDDADVTVPPHPVGPLASGRYFWRVQSIAADGSRSAFSPIASFEIRAPGSARLAVGRTEAFQAGSTRHTLEVPLIAQHKDTALLLVESDQPSPHAWDEVHPGLDPGDPADLMNCGLAAAAMVNAYFGGDVSQDQIGFHLFRNVEGGPEGDLNYGKGVSPRQETDALRFALGLGKDEIELKGSPLPEDFWEDVVSEISVGRPIVVAVPGHVEVVIGYDAGETRLIGLNDPFTAENGPTWVPVEKLDIRSYWRLTRTPSRPFRTTGRRLTPTRMGSWTSTRMCDSERIRPKETRMATASGTSARSATDGSTGRFVKT
ncbi:MAG: hypothetical protein QOJ59_3881, partial [Thermomicrobiales bacterium]|nr:hypothetical protein [Thermomicrobiales bacterium]